MMGYFYSHRQFKYNLFSRYRQYYDGEENATFEIYRFEKLSRLMRHRFIYNFYNKLTNLHYGLRPFLDLKLAKKYKMFKIHVTLSKIFLNYNYNYRDVKHSRTDIFNRNRISVIFIIFNEH